MRPRTNDGENMKTRISALMDGELEVQEIPETLRAIRHSEELRSQWCDCQLIGAALRGERALDVDVTTRVMSALELEPTVMAPARRTTADWQRPVLALAASAAGVAVVAWLALSPGSDATPASSGNLADAKAAVVAQATPRLQEYLVAHQAYAPAGAMVGGARNIRTVAVSGEGR